MASSQRQLQTDASPSSVWAFCSFPMRTHEVLGEGAARPRQPGPCGFYLLLQLYGVTFGPSPKPLGSSSPFSCFGGYGRCSGVPSLIPETREDHGLSLWGMLASHLLSAAHPTLSSWEAEGGGGEGGFL